MNDAHWWVVAMIYFMPENKTVRYVFGAACVIVLLIKQ